MFTSRLFTLIALSSIVFAQQSTPKFAGALSPVPIFPQNGQIPNSLAGQYVFFDPANHDLVLYYPTDASADGQGDRTKLLIHLSNRFEPSVSVQFKPRPAGLIDYDYTISNGAKSKDQISFWSMKTSIVPALTPDQAVVEATGAGASRHELAPSDWAAPSVARADDSGRVISWSAGLTGKSIAPGQSYSGFALTGEALQPGFVLATFSSTPQPQPLSSQNVPSAVQNQLSQLDRLNFQFKTVLTLGPRYQAQDAKLSRVADFYAGASLLIQAGHLKQDSPFVSEMMNALKTYLDGATQSPPMPIKQFIDTPIQIKGSPTNWLESQILEAMKISIGVNGA